MDAAIFSPSLPRGAPAFTAVEGALPAHRAASGAASILLYTPLQVVS